MSTWLIVVRPLIRALVPGLLAAVLMALVGAGLLERSVLECLTEHKPSESSSKASEDQPDGLPSLMRKSPE